VVAHYCYFYYCCCSSFASSFGRTESEPTSELPSSAAFQGHVVVVSRVVVFMMRRHLWVRIDEFR
jgi:hypothetical protein